MPGDPTARRARVGERRAAFLDRELSGSGWDPPKRHRKRRLPRIKGVEITDELQTRNVPTVVVRQKIERRRVGVPLALEQHAEVGVAKVAEHQARHVAGSYRALRSGLPPEQPGAQGDPN
jgi:hypothetical protein